MTTESSGGDRRPVSRRQVLAWSLAAAAGAGLSGTGMHELLERVRTIAADANGVVRAVLTRPQDQLYLQFELLNFRRYVAGEDGPGDRTAARVVVLDPAQPAFLVVHFTPQNVAERAYFEVHPSFPGQGGDETPLLTTPVPAVVADASRLVFLVPATATPIPLTPEALLNWTGLSMSVVPAAARTVSGRPGPQQPAPTQTAIEAPWGLTLSPDEGAGWAHSAAPVTHGDRTELWHTRLAVRQGSGVDEHDAIHRTVRAVWTTGYTAGIPRGADPAPPGRTSLTLRQRYDIVRLSSDYSLNIIAPGSGTPTPYQPRPVAVNRLMLSALGAWLDSDGSWDSPLHPAGLDYTFTVQQWLHRATMGRDNYVKVVEGGFLFPFGHRASLVTITERVFEAVPSPPSTQQPQQLAAFNRQRMFILVREAERSYPDSLAFQPHGGRAMPFKKIRIATEVTPNLAAPDGTNVEATTKVKSDPGYATPFYGKEAFWPVVPSSAGPRDFPFTVEGEDAAGQRCQFTAPLIFVSAALSNDKVRTTQIIAEYTAAAAERRERSLSGRRVKLTNLPGDSTYPVESVTLGAELPSPNDATLDYRRQPRFFPTLTGMAVHLDAVEQVTGKPAAAAPAPITWHPGYLDGAVNPGALFAKLTNPIDLKFGADAVGALTTPDLNIGGLSALTGLMGGGSLPDLPQSFDPNAFFALAAPKILGALPLTAIIKAVDFSALEAIPRLIKAELPDAVTVSYTWKPKVTHDTDSIFVPVGDGTDNLSIRATSTVRRSGGAPSFEVVGELKNFTLNVIGVGKAQAMAISFKTLRFTARDGLKATVAVDISGVVFKGALSFINPLQDFLAKLGLVPAPHSLAKAALSKAPAADPPPNDPPPNGPFVDVTLAGIRAGYNLALPKIPVGVFSLENIAISAAVNIPFVGDPARVRFAFAERERPFLITVAMFGGGGFCALQLGLDGFERFEVALEFGAKFALDLGVASGGVSAMAGIYLALGPASAGELTGYVRINGELHVLGLISLGLEFYLGLTYEFQTGVASGQARLTVSVDIAFFSTSVTLGPIEKRFGGGTPPAAHAATSAQAKSALANGKPRALAAAGGVPPGVDDLMTQPEWADPVAGYCAMFAPAAFA